MESNKHFLTAFVKSADIPAREIYARASAGVLDRDNEIVRWNAFQGGGLDDFLQHPVLLVGHDYKGLWVAKITEIDPKPDGLYFRAKFATTPEADEVWQLIKDTGIAAFSIGFLPVNSEQMTVKSLLPSEKASALSAGFGMMDIVKVHTRVKLLEISLVSVPSCQTALLISWTGKRIKTKGLNSALRDWARGLGRQGEEIISIVEGKSVRLMRAEAELAKGKTPDRVREYVAALLETVDFERVVREQVGLAIDRVRGRVR